MRLNSIFALILALLFALPAHAEISFLSATNAAQLSTTTPNDDGSTVFIFKGLADGESSDISFAITGDCPLVATMGGAEFNSNWSCANGVITTSVTYKGGLTFGPATDENQDSFYMAFTNPPGAEEQGSAFAALAGIQIALYGDISHWELSGQQTAQGAAFGVELSGEQGSAAHFQMDLPAAAVTFLGGVLGVTIDGKPNPFASVTTHEDGSVSIIVDIKSLQTGSLQTSALKLKGGKTVTRKILASERALSVAPSKTSAKAGTSISLAMCAGKTFTAGDKAQVSYLLGGKTSSSFKSSSFTLNSLGCATKKLKIPSSASGNLVAKVSYQGKKATGKVKITR